MLSATLSALEAFPDQLEALFHAFPHDRTHWVPGSWEGCPSETFTALEQICHVRDIEVDGYHLRFSRMLSETSPALASIDSDALAKERGYAAATPAQVFESFRAARQETVALLRTLSDDQLARSGTFDGYGSLTLRALIHYLSSHDQQHLAGLQWLLGKVASIR